MKTIKLVVTLATPLRKKYGAPGLARIDKAIRSVSTKDAARKVTTIYLHLDDATAMRKYRAVPVTGRPTSAKCKNAIDDLFAALSPDYLVLLGTGDVLPFFFVPNPSFEAGGDGDSDELVPTDNPYASSKPFKKKRIESYLVPDRVVGRIPDLPGATDPAALLEYLAATRSWKLRPPTEFQDDYLVCCDSWKTSGAACVSYLSRPSNRLLISPPTTRTTPGPASKRYAAKFHMIKCHGAQIDASFYGQKGNRYPDVLSAADLRKKTTTGTVVGAMCCYGGAVFDPNDPAAVSPGEQPIPTTYLRQGGYGYFGSTTIAWVGADDMQCADWVVSAALKAVMNGASLGRALLESKQGFVQWIQQQGNVPDIAEEKTLLQYHLLGDPSIHLVPMAHAPATAQPPAVARRARRAHAHTTAAQLCADLPERLVVSRKGKRIAIAAAGAKTLAQPHRPTDKAAGTAFAALRRTISVQLRGFVFGSPLVHAVRRRIEQPELRAARASGVAPAKRRTSGAMASTASYEYYYSARKKTKRVIDARMIKVETDERGRLIRTRVLASS